MSLFYRTLGLTCLESPPRLSSPGNQNDGNREKLEPSEYIGAVFPYLHQLWSIMHEVALLCTRNGGPLAPERRLCALWNTNSVNYWRGAMAWSNGADPNTITRRSRPTLCASKPERYRENCQPGLVFLAARILEQNLWQIWTNKVRSAVSGCGEIGG